MDFLKAEIEKKRKRNESLYSTEGSTTKKYLRQRDLEKKREEEYLKEQTERERQREEKLKEKNRTQFLRLAEQKKGDKSGSDGEGHNTGANSSDTLNIAVDEVVRRLRAKGQPIRLFGETDEERKIRLRALEVIEERTEGQRNDFMKTLEEMETGLDLEVLGSRGDGSADKDEKKKKIIEDSALDATQISLELLEKDPDKLHMLIYTFFKRLLREWEQELNNRPDNVKRSTQGKLQAAIQRQTTEYLKPFFRTLKRKRIEPDVLARVTEITHYMQKREYINANDAYLRLSIGNAPWPIGVTMVGIHERSAREKIFSAQVAHVLNDEATRKWIQSIKRLMTFCQSKYPPKDNSQLMG
ncbi:1543_t:CDS:2 [Paraglomus occultum]|uniref:Pre-mRNA-splicing factor 18 n=1 Tax=Paraglomus occultum TaxID=144539 RepID=A0A9N9AKE9_9GLOM|nr:1543_t:CDS:2 [Paraglomus occultum]